MNVAGLERLEVWKMAKDFTLSVYRDVLPCLQVEEKWGLNQQIRRAAQSIRANIAEGHGRYHYQDNVRFCYIARGSLVETVSHLTLAHELGYLSKPVYIKIIQQSEDLIRMINGYIAYLKRSRKGEDENGSPSTIREEPENYLFDENNNF